MTLSTWWWWLFCRLQGFWENVRPFTPCLHFFFFQWRLALAHKFHSLRQDWSTVAKRAEKTVAKCSLTSCMWACPPIRSSHKHHFWLFCYYCKAFTSWKVDKGSFTCSMILTHVVHMKVKQALGLHKYWLGRYGKIPQPVKTRSQTRTIGFTVQCISQPATNPPLLCPFTTSVWDTVTIVHTMLPWEQCTASHFLVCVNLY